MALSNDALVSLDEVKRYYFPDMDKSKSQDDDNIESLIDSVTDQFEKYCGIDSFHDNDYTEYIDSIYGCDQFVKNIPINSITSIYNDFDWSWDESTLLDSDDYMIKGSRYITFKYGFYAGNQNLKVTYNGGFTTIPSDLKLACIKEVARSFKNRYDIDVNSKSLEDGSKTRVDDGLMRSTKQVIDKYKIVRAI